jgi:hypothetical protein
VHRRTRVEVVQSISTAKVRLAREEKWCGLRAAGCGLRAAGCGLRAAGCGLRAAQSGTSDDVRSRTTIAGSPRMTFSDLPNQPS